VNERVSEALDLLTVGLKPYVEQKLRTIYKDNWVRTATGSFRDERSRVNGDTVDWDAHSLLTVMWDQWNTVFRHDLGHAERSLVSELREYRNRWAHQQEFDFDDTYRILDSVRRLLLAAGATNVCEVDDRKRELLESHVAELVNSQIQRTAFNRNKWWVIGIYSLCGVMIIAHMLLGGNLTEKPGAMAVASITFLTLVYLIYLQFRMEPPLLFGPRECPRCHKIIYRKTCPYCEPSAP
jgi:hypothetical protein